MDEITRRLTWPQLRNHVEARASASLLSYSKTGKVYRVWIKDGGVILESKFTEGHAHGQEFEADYLPNVQPLTGDSGHKVVTINSLPINATNYEKSWLYEGPEGVTSIFDERIEGAMVGPKGTMYLTGGQYEIIGALKEGSSLEFSIVDRDDVLGLFVVTGATSTKMEGLTNIAGPGLQAGRTVRGQTSGAEAVITVVGVDYLDIRANYTGTFQDGEIVEQLDPGGTPDGTTADLGAPAITEGTPLVLNEYIEDEWVQTGSIRGISPDGSKKLAEGLYLRTKFYVVPDLSYASGKVKITFEMGRI